MTLKKYFIYNSFNYDKQIFTAKLTKDAQTLSAFNNNQLGKFQVSKCQIKMIPSMNFDLPL